MLYKHKTRDLQVATTCSFFFSQTPTWNLGFAKFVLSFPGFFYLCNRINTFYFCLFKCCICFLFVCLCKKGYILIYYLFCLCNSVLSFKCSQGYILISSRLNSSLGWEGNFFYPSSFYFCFWFFWYKRYWGRDIWT